MSTWMYFLRTISFRRQGVGKYKGKVSEISSIDCETSVGKGVHLLAHIIWKIDRQTIEDNFDK